MDRFDYWDEAVTTSLEENGVTATAEQIKAIAGDMQASHENIGQAFHVPESGRDEEKEQLRRDLERERRAEWCPTCNGSGREIMYGGTFQSNSECSKCRGRGRLYP